MNLRQIIPTDITASAIAHLSLLALLFVFSEVHQLGSVTADPIAVDIVTTQEVVEKEAAETKPDPTPTPQLDLSTREKPAAATAPAAAAQQPAPAQPQKQAALPAARPAQPQQQPQQQQQQPQQQQPPQQQQQPAAAPPLSSSASPSPAYAPIEPDLSIKYHVLLGLPQDLSPAPPVAPSQSRDAANYNFDAAATKAADIGSGLVADFRRHLRICSKLPPSLKATDDVKVKLRVFLTQDGKLASEPILIEASASMKGPLLMQSAISALQACQPYAMLPVNRYGEWKVLDLNFTPQDFAGAS